MNEHCITSATSPPSESRWGHLHQARSESLDCPRRNQSREKLRFGPIAPPLFCPLTPSAWLSRGDSSGSWNQSQF